MSGATLSPQRLRMLLLATACNVSVWVLLGVFATSEFQRRAIVMGGAGAPWNEVFVFQMCTALLWAAFAPLAVFLAQRFPLRPPHRLRNAIVLLALIPCLAVLRAAGGGAVHDLAEGVAVSREMVSVSIRIRTHPNIAILAAIFFVSNLVDAKREAAKRERQRVHAQTLVARAQMEELRTRLQPQFAVRMLRHIGSVLRDEPRAADALIVTLSSILRRSMVRGSREPVRLADELEHFDRCLDLCRIGGRFSVAARYVADDDVLACRVPPVVLQPVIESVVLDLTSGDGGSVEVHCEREGDEAHVEVCWTVAPGGAAMKTTLRIPTEEATA
jgi:two-component system, LytTR family, sensor kinase